MYNKIKGKPRMNSPNYEYAFLLMSTFYISAQKVITSLAGHGIYWKYHHNAPYLLRILAVDKPVENVDNFLYLQKLQLFMSTDYTEFFKI